MDSSFALIGAHQHDIAVGFMNGENPRVSKYSCKRQLHTTHAPELLAGNCTALLPRHARGKQIRSYPDLCASCRIRETEDWGEFNISSQLYTVLYREIVIFCTAFLREYSYICSHYGFTSFYAMWSPGNFKVPLTLTVKRKRIVRFEGLPQFKWSDLGGTECFWTRLIRSGFYCFR